MTWEDPTEWGTTPPPRVTQRRYPNARQPEPVPMPIMETLDKVFWWVYIGLLAVFAWPLTLLAGLAFWEHNRQQRKAEEHQRRKAEGKNWRPKADRNEEIEDPGTDDFVAVRERISHEYTEIERATRTDPGDPAILHLIEKLTEEVERIDRRVVHELNEQARLPFSELVAGKPPKHPTRHYPEG